ncbi:330_t:CDS:2, partial [Funneliformis geosporum]
TLEKLKKQQNKYAKHFAIKMPSPPSLLRYVQNPEDQNPEGS